MWHLGPHGVGGTVTTASQPVSVQNLDVAGPERVLETDPAASDRGARRTDVSHRWWPGAICLALYAVMALAVFGHVTSLGPGLMTGGRSADQIAQVWWLAWAQYALAHGHSLFFTNWQNYPVGYNFGVNGSFLVLGVLFSPLTTLFGPIVTWNVLVRLALIASAFSMCLVLRRWTRWWPAAFVGGAVYGFSGYMTFYASGYLFLTFVPIPPLIFLVVHEILVRQTWRPARAGALLGLLFAVQYLIFPEVLASTVLLGALACLLYVLRNRKAVAVGAGYLKRAALWTLGVGVVALGFPLLFTFFGTQHSNGAVGSPGNLEAFHGDLLGPLVPSHQLRFSTSAFHVLWSQVLTPSMYLGVPLFVAVVVTVVLLRRRGVVVLSAVMMVISLLLSLGTVLYVDGHNTHVPLPLQILTVFPVTEGFQSTRFSLFTALFGAAILAIGLEALHAKVLTAASTRRLTRRSRVMLAAVVPLALAVVVTLPLLPARPEQASATHESTFFTSAAAAAIPSGSVVLAYPLPNTPFVPGRGVSAASQSTLNDVLLDQAMVGMRFKLVGGYGWRPTNGLYDSPRPSRLDPPSVEVLLNTAFSGGASSGQSKVLEKADLTSDLRQFLHRYGVDTVVVLPYGADPAAVVRAMEAALGPPTHAKDATVWFHVQERLRSVSST